MSALLMIVSFFVNYLLLSLWSPFFLLLAAFFLPPETLRTLDASPGWQQWLMTVLILVPGLLMQLPFFQRVMIFTSGWKSAQGPYRQVLEQALEPVIRRGGLEGETFHLYVNPEKSFNACALGDNNIIVNEPMFQYFTVEELSGILAHEMGHLQKGHTWKLLLLWCMSTANRACFRIYSLFLALLTVLQFIPVLGFILVFFCIVMNFILRLGNWLLGWPLTLFNRYCSRQDEYAADAYACQLGLGPELYSGLAKLDTMYHNPQLGFFGRMFSDHPATDDRLERIREESGM